MLFLCTLAEVLGLQHSAQKNKSADWIGYCMRKWSLMSTPAIEIAICLLISNRNQSSG